MSDGAKLRLGLYITSLVIAVLGVWVMLPAAGWRGLLGLALLLWANNIGMTVRQKGDQARMEEVERLERLVELIRSKPVSP